MSKILDQFVIIDLNVKIFKLPCVRVRLISKPLTLLLNFKIFFNPIVI
jgi:hypothetical protein